MPAVACPSCHQSLTVPDGAGSFRCPKCQAAVAVNGASRLPLPTAQVTAPAPWTRERWLTLVRVCRVVRVAVWGCVALLACGLALLFLVMMATAKSAEGAGLAAFFSAVEAACVLVAAYVLASAIDRVLDHVQGLTEPR